jgi:hypothetical protein
VGEIAGEGFEGRDSAAVAVDLLHLLDAAEAAASQEPRRFGRHAAFNEPPGFHVEMELQLLIQFLVKAALPEQCPDTPHKRFEPVHRRAPV